MKHAVPDVPDDSAYSDEVTMEAPIETCVGNSDPAGIESILAHLRGKEPSAELAMLPEGLAPPQARLGAPG